MNGVNNWIIHAANVTIGRALGIVFDNVGEIVVPGIVIFGIIGAWIAFRPRKPKY